MSKIAIIGNAGGGKSVLARRVGKALHLPAYVIDDVQWQPGWQPTPVQTVSTIHQRWLEESRWIPDGSLGAGFH